MLHNQETTTPDLLRDNTTTIVAAYVGKNAVSATDLPKLISDVHSALRTLGTALTPAPVVDLKPAVPVKRSITPHAIICLEDGKPFKSLKRHLSSHYGLSPEQYRAKWGLPADYGRKPLAN